MTASVFGGLVAVLQVTFLDVHMRRVFVERTVRTCDQLVIFDAPKGENRLETPRRLTQAAG